MPEISVKELVKIFGAYSTGTRFKVTNGFFSSPNRFECGPVEPY